MTVLPVNMTSYDQAKMTELEHTTTAQRSITSKKWA